jgi:hypothetical protein
MQPTAGRCDEHPIDWIKNAKNCVPEGNTRKSITRDLERAYFAFPDRLRNADESSAFSA